MVKYRTTHYQWTVSYNTVNLCNWKTLGMQRETFSQIWKKWSSTWNIWDIQRCWKLCAYENLCDISLCNMVLHKYKVFPNKHINVKKHTEKVCFKLWSFGANEGCFFNKYGKAVCFFFMLNLSHYNKMCPCLKTECLYKMLSSKWNFQCNYKFW